MSTVWNSVHLLKGATLTTLHRRKQFTVLAVDDEYVRVVPQDGVGKPRSVRRDRIEHIAHLGLERDRLVERTRQELLESRNTSYIAAIAWEALKQSPSTL